MLWKLQRHRFQHAVFLVRVQSKNHVIEKRKQLHKTSNSQATFIDNDEGAHTLPPCGSDLDALQDPAYANIMFQAENLLPESFFTFKPVTSTLETIFENLNNLRERTTHLNVLVTYAKLRILNQEYVEFIETLEHIATVSEMQWNEVHPQNNPQYRIAILQTLQDITPVLLPLQHMPLIHDRQLGAIYYRAFLLAQADIEPRDDDNPLEASQLQTALESADVEALQTTYMSVWRIQDAAHRIEYATRQNQNEAGICVKLDALTLMTASILAILSPQIKAQNPDFIQDDAANNTPQQHSIAQQEQTQKPVLIHTTQDVKSAFICLERYFHDKEPSSPSLLLIKQAHELIGKSFAECIQILIPNKLEDAYIPIGAQSDFKIAVTHNQALPMDQKSAPIVKKWEFVINNRRDVNQLLEEISAFYKQQEPTSPIPILCEKAVDLGEQNFLSLLQTLFPK